MKFSLDADDRFRLQSREGGWDLIVDDKTVFYCRTPLEAVKYMSEELRDADTASGARDVVAALARVEDQVAKAVEVLDAFRAGEQLGTALARVSKPLGSRRECVMYASLHLAGCSLAEFKVRSDRRQFVAMAKAILEPCFEVWGI